MLEKDVRVLRLRSVAGVRIHNQLSVGQMLRQEKGVDRHDDNIFVPMCDQCGLLYLPQHGKAVF